MTKYIALLRGINVSGQKIIKMEHLKNYFIDMGFTDVKTYIQSGNVVFQSKDKDAEKLSKHIEKAQDKMAKNDKGDSKPGSSFFRS